MPNKVISCVLFQPHTPQRPNSSPTNTYTINPTYDDTTPRYTDVVCMRTETKHRNEHQLDPQHCTPADELLLGSAQQWRYTGVEKASPRFGGDEAWSQACRRRAYRPRTRAHRRRLARAQPRSGGSCHQLRALAHYPLEARGTGIYTLAPPVSWYWRVATADYALRSMYWCWWFFRFKIASKIIDTMRWFLIWKKENFIVKVAMWYQQCTIEKFKWAEDINDFGWYRYDVWYVRCHED